MICKLCLLVLLFNVEAVRVTHDENFTKTSDLKEGDACNQACNNKAGVCDACGGINPGGSVAHVCCRPASSTVECKHVVKTQTDVVWSEASKKKTDRQCVTMAESPFQVFATKDVANVLPQPWLTSPDEYVDFPEKLKGLIWMDQVGYYGFSDIGEGNTAPDAVVSFGDTRDHWKLHKHGQNRQYVDIFGPAWTWFNNADAYHAIPHLGGFGFYYDFQWEDENFNFVKIKPTVSSGFLTGVAGMAVSFDMRYQPEYKAAGCPPKAEDVWFPEMQKDKEKPEDVIEYKKYVSKCAKWHRGSDLPLLGHKDYYAFEIVDAVGAPVTPYFEKYVEFVDSKNAPDVQKAIKDGMILANLDTKSTSIVGKVS